jgi:hypothetical protein
MPTTYIPVKGLKVAKQYLLNEAGYLLNMQGSPWAFVGVAVMIDHCARLRNGGRTVDVQAGGSI